MDLNAAMHRSFASLKMTTRTCARICGTTPPVPHDLLLLSIQACWWRAGRRSPAGRARRPSLHRIIHGAVTVLVNSLGVEMWPVLLVAALNVIDQPILDEIHGFRSEEHTSELQSLRHLVCRLLLELYGDHRDLHSFPTRRSSDLLGVEMWPVLLVAALNVIDQPILDEIHGF